MFVQSNESGGIGGQSGIRCRCGESRIQPEDDSLLQTTKSDVWRRERDSVCDYSQIVESFRKFETPNAPNPLKTRGPSTTQVQCPSGASVCHPRDHADISNRRRSIIDRQMIARRPVTKHIQRTASD